LIRNILHTFGTRSVSAVINFLIAIVISQYLGPEGKGEQGIIIATITFLLVFSNLVGGGTLVYLVPRYNISVLILPSYAWSLLISILAYWILLIFDIVNPDMALHISILSFVTACASIHSTLLIGRKMINSANLINLIQPVIIILSLLLFFLVLNTRTVEAYIYSLYISFSFSLLISLFYVIKTFEKITLQPFAEYLMIIRELFRLGFLNQMAHITQIMSFRLSYYFLEELHGEASVGIYSNGIQLMESIWLISKSISLVQYAQIANTEDKKYSQMLSVNLLKAGSLMSLVFIIPLLVFPESFYLFLFGEGFAGLKQVIWILAPGVLIYNISIILGHYFSGTGKYYVNTIASSIGLVVSLGLYIVLIPEYAIAGAGIAASVSYAVTSAVVMAFFLRDARTSIHSFFLTSQDISLIKDILLTRITKHNRNENL
jgi:O-antigen/teichoic acid export membrane protein